LRSVLLPVRLLRLLVGGTRRLASTPAYTYAALQPGEAVICTIQSPSPFRGPSWCGTCLWFLFADTRLVPRPRQRVNRGWTDRTGPSPSLDKLATAGPGNDRFAGIFGKSFPTFVISAAMLSLILTVTAANKGPGQPYRSHVAQLRKHEPNKHRGNSRVARATAKDKSTSVVADAGRLPKVAGK
jgi:hypothetical protein